MQGCKLVYASVYGTMSACSCLFVTVRVFIYGIVPMSVCAGMDQCMSV